MLHQVAVDELVDAAIERAPVEELRGVWETGRSTFAAPPLRLRILVVEHRMAEFVVDDPNGGAHHLVEHRAVAQAAVLALTPLKH